MCDYQIKYQYFKLNCFSTTPLLQAYKLSNKIKEHLKQYHQSILTRRFQWLKQETRNTLICHIHIDDPHLLMFEPTSTQPTKMPKKKFIFQTSNFKQFQSNSPDYQYPHKNGWPHSTWLRNQNGPRLMSWPQLLSDSQEERVGR